MKLPIFRLSLATLFTIVSLFLPALWKYLLGAPEAGLFHDLYSHLNIISTIGFGWLAFSLIELFKALVLRRHDLDAKDNLEARKVVTQIKILGKVLKFLVFLLVTGLVLMSFENIRKIGIGLFASAGLAGIIIGLSAQKIVGALLAGLQIALTQPFRIDDAVVVEGEWGYIEEIHLTYVVVRIWDKRRLVLPSSYFLEKPFQNWTRVSAELIGSVFLYTDYRVPFDKLRAELTRLLKSTPLWDGQVNVLQVTASKETTVEIRILASAADSPTTWDLRVFVREKMIEYLQKNFPESLPRTRVSLTKEIDHQYLS